MCCSGEREREICEVRGVIATPVSRRRIGKYMPGVVRQGPNLAAIAVCRDWLEESHAACVVLHGSRGWDEQSDLNLIVVHGAAGDRGKPGGAVERARERHYWDSLDEQSNLESGAGVVTPGHYNAGRRTLNHPMARAASPV